MNILIKAVLLSTLLSPFSSFAEAVKVDWKEDGDQLAFVDTQTAVEWLKLSETTGYTIRNITEHFPGWRLPNQTEVEKMLLNIFDIVDAGEHSHQSPTDPDKVALWYDLFGSTNSVRSSGFYFKDDGTMYQAGEYNNAYFMTDYTDSNYNNRFQTMSFSYIGIFLVRKSDLPWDVSTPLVFTSLLLPTFFLRKRKHKARLG